MTETETMLLTGEAARALGCSPDAVRLWEREGKLPATKTPTGRRLFALGDVQELARERALAAQEGSEAT